MKEVHAFSSSIFNPSVIEQPSKSVSKFALKEVSTLFHSLDIYPPLLGFLDSRKADFTGSSVNTVSHLDVISYKLLTKKGALRQCVRCNRLTVWNNPEEVYWDLTCVCGGLWKKVHISSSMSKRSVVNE